MSFFNQHCPNCGKTVSKNAEFCNACGCPTATSWASCTRCHASVGADSKFCWKCGAEQDFTQRRAIYGDRWHRSPTDFAVRVDIALPEQSLRHGIQVDEYTLALVFQDGRYTGSLDPGYHVLDTFLQRLLHFKPGKECHAILLDTRSAEIDFALENIRVAGHLPVDVQVRLLFRVDQPERFVGSVVGDATSFTTDMLAQIFRQDVFNAVQDKLKDRNIDDLMIEPRARELVEETLLAHLTPLLANYGLVMDGVRLARFGGQAIDYITEKLGEISRLNREFELNRELRDATRKEKMDAFREEWQIYDYYEQVTHDFGFKSAEREQERRQFMQAADHRFQLEGLRQDYENRRAEILNRLDEQKLQHESQLRDVEQELQVRSRRFVTEIEEARRRGDLGREQQEKQAELDRQLQVKEAEAGLAAGLEGLKLAKAAQDFKDARRKSEEEINLHVLRQKMELFGGASKQALLSVLDQEQADRILKLAELEMRQGLSAEQALALVAEKSPEIAPAIAAALSAKYGAGKPEKE